MWHTLCITRRGDFCQIVANAAGGYIFCRTKNISYLAVEIRFINTKKRIAYRKNSALELTKIEEYECDSIKRPRVA